VRILIYRLGSLGDTVVALPCFRLIRAQNPGAEIVVLTNVPVSGKAAAIEAVLDSTGLVDRYIPYPLGLRDPKQLAALRRELLAEKFDRVISLAASRGLFASVRDYLFFRSCGITSISGIPWRRRDLEPARIGGAMVENESARLLRRVGWTAPEAADGRDLGLTPAEHTLAERLLDDVDVAFPFIAASIGTKSALNDWGGDNWRALLAALSRDFPTHGLVLIGSGEEKERSESLLEAWTGPRGNLCGAAGPRVTAAILARARLFLGHDSGPMHLAAATGIPVVAVFSARNPPGQWFPGGSGHGVLYPYSFYNPARREDAAHQRAAIDSITVEQVRRAAHLHLPSPAAASLHRA
jgi:heptosyltransferase-3